MSNYVVAALLFPVLAYGANDYLQNYINTALQNNPALQAAQKNYEAENARISGLGTLEYPKLDIGFYPEPMELKHGKQVAQFSVMQMFNWPGTQGAAQTEAMAMARMQAAKTQSLKNELVMKIKSEWNSLVAIKKVIEYKKQILEIQKRLENLTIENLKVSDYSAVLDANSEILELEFELESLQSEMQIGIANFNALLGQDLNTEISLADTLFLAEPDTAKTTENPMLAMLNAESQSYKSQIAMSQKMGSPMFGLGLQYMLINKLDNMGGKDMIMIMGQMTLPIWRGKTNASINEAIHKSEAAQKYMINTKNELDVQKTQAKRQLELAKRKISLYIKQVELASSKHKIALQNLSAGKSGLPEVLQINIEFINYQIKEIEAIAEYNSAVASLEMVYGENY
jgi:outer membrane protein TolC